MREKEKEKQELEEERSRERERNEGRQEMMTEVSSITKAVYTGLGCSGQEDSVPLDRSPSVSCPYCIGP